MAIIKNVSISNIKIGKRIKNTIWDISTASYDNKSFSVAAQDSFPTSIHFRDDGSQMFMVGQTNKRKNQ